MKAWLVRVKHDFGASIVFAETRGKARSLALDTDCCEDAQFCDIEVRRAPNMDKYYKEGKREMDWFNSKDRIALVKDAYFVCDIDYLQWEDCESCSAKDYCDRYQDHLKESEDTE